MIRPALAIARVKLVLELRRREVLFAMLLFIAATIVIVRSTCAHVQAVPSVESKWSGCAPASRHLL